MHRKAYETAADLAAGKSLLDWGCNNGYGMEIMRRSVSEIAGLDVAKHAVAAAQRRLPDIKSNIRLYDGARVPFPPGTFDVVTSFQVLEHVSDYDGYLRGVVRSLKPGGMAILTTPNRKIRLHPGMKPWNPFHVYEYSAEELQARLAPFFSRVQIRGLRSRPEVEAVEKRRCEAEKEAARRSPTPPWRVFLRRIRGLARIFRASNRLFTLAQDDLGNFSVDDFQYVDTELDEALDLMAVCAK